MVTQPRKPHVSGIKIKLLYSYTREPNCIFLKLLKGCTETSTYLGSLKKFEGATGEFEEVMGYDSS